MDVKAARFLAAVLGTPGAAVLTELAKSEPAYEGYLIPRAALAWLRLTESSEQLPGVPEVAMRLAEGGGYIGIDGLHFRLEGAPQERVAAYIAKALDAAVVPASSRDVDLARLGRSVDALAKAQKTHGEAGSGVRASPVGAIPPAAPTAEQLTQQNAKKRPPKVPFKAVKPKVQPVLKLSEADGHRKCSSCGESQFKEGKFKGCFCLRGLVKSVGIEPDGTGWRLDLGKLDADEALLFHQLCRSKYGE